MPEQKAELPEDWQNEWNKSLSRWFFLVATMLFLFWLKWRNELNAPVHVVIKLVICAVVVAAIIHLLLWRRFCPRWFKYVTVIADHTLMSTVVFISGGNASMFFPAYYIILFSNGSRYGMGMALYTAMVFNIVYIVMLLLQPVAVAPAKVAPEGVRILFYWAAAVYIGFVASRFHRLARVVEAHEATIRDLRETIRSDKPEPERTQA